MVEPARFTPAYAPFDFAYDRTGAFQPTEPAVPLVGPAATASAPSWKSPFIKYSSPFSFISMTISDFCNPAWKPTLPPEMLKNAGAVQPCALRQLTTPEPCSPPAMNPPLVILGMTPMHFASLSTCS